MLRKITAAVLSAVLGVFSVFGGVGSLGFFPISVSAGYDVMTGGFFPDGISAECAVLLTEDGRVIYAKNADLRHGIASTTKIMTAVLTLEHLSLDSVVTVPAQACGIEGTSLYLTQGETLTVRDLLYAVMLRSANDAAATLAIAVSGSISEFADLMNQKAALLGMTGSHFANPHGLPDDAHYSTASDMARLALYAMQNDDFCRIVSAKSYRITRAGAVSVLTNHNRMLSSYQGSLGIKTGFTKNSGRCLVSAAERNDVRLIAVTLNAPNDWADHGKLLDYGFSLFEKRVILEANTCRRSVDVIGGTGLKLSVTNPTAAEAVMKKEDGEPTVRYELPHVLFAPICRGEVIGKAVFSLNGTVIGRCDLVAAESVSARH